MDDPGELSSITVGRDARRGIVRAVARARQPQPRDAS